jgi:hypothetical protein
MWLSACNRIVPYAHLGPFRLRPYERSRCCVGILSLSIALTIWLCVYIWLVATTPTTQPTLHLAAATHILLLLLALCVCAIDGSEHRWALIIAVIGSVIGLPSAVALVYNFHAFYLEGDGVDERLPPIYRIPMAIQAWVWLFVVAIISFLFVMLCIINQFCHRPPPQPESQPESQPKAQPESQTQHHCSHSIIHLQIPLQPLMHHISTFLTI